jgi:transposase-like protein
LCGHEKAHKHGKTSKGKQRYKCPNCGKTFPEHLDTLYYNRQIGEEEAQMILQSHMEGSSLRGITRIVGRAYGTVVSLVREASARAMMIHNREVEEIETEEIAGDEMWSFVEKNRKTVWKEN